MSKIIVGIGEILWDVFPDKKILGGAPANFAYHISQLGYNGYAVSAVGNDLLGKEILDSLKDKKLNYLIESIDYPTGTVKVTLNEEGVPQYEICEQVAWDYIPFTERIAELAKNTAAVCFGSLAQRNKTSRETIQKFLKIVPSHCIKIFDINLRQHFYTKTTIEESMKMSDILKMNDDEIKVIADMYNWREIDEQQICRNLLKIFSLDLIILTKGTEGSFIFNSESTSYQPTPKVAVKDTVGAGDSFTAAFIAAYMQGKPISEAHKFAVEVSAYVCEQHGAMPELSEAHTRFLELNTLPIK